jgi:hypothetical protein
MAEAITEYMYLLAAILLIIITFPFWLGEVTTFINSLTTQGLAQLIPNTFHPLTSIIVTSSNTPIISMDNTGFPITLLVGITEICGTCTTVNSTIAFNTGYTNIPLPKVVSFPASYEISFNGQNGAIYDQVYVMVFNSTYINIANTFSYTKINLNGVILNITPINNNATFVIPFGTYNLTFYNQYDYNSINITESDSVVSASANGILTNMTVDVNKYSYGGSTSQLPLATLNINHGSTVYQTGSNGNVIFPYTANALIELNVSCAINICGSTPYTTNTVIKNQEDFGISNSILLYPEYSTTVNLQVECDTSHAVSPVSGVIQFSNTTYSSFNVYDSIGSSGSANILLTPFLWTVTGTSSTNIVGNTLTYAASGAGSLTMDFMSNQC